MQNISLTKPKPLPVMCDDNAVVCPYSLGSAP